RRVRWQGDREGGTLTWLTGDGDVAAHHLAEATRERESETGATVFPRRRRVGLRERLEEPAELLGGHADTGVRHAEDDAVAGNATGLPRHRERDGAALGELGRVAQQVEERLANLGQVREHLAGAI